MKNVNYSLSEVIEIAEYVRTNNKVTPSVKTEDLVLTFLSVKYEEEKKIEQQVISECNAISDALYQEALRRYPVGTNLTSHFGVDLVVTNESIFKVHVDYVTISKCLKINSFIYNRVENSYEQFIIYSNTNWSDTYEMSQNLKLTPHQLKLIKI